MPMLVVGRALKARGHTVLVVANRESDERPTKAAGLTFEGISTGKLRRYLGWHTALDAIRLLGGMQAAARIVHDFQPDVIFGKGGYVSFPVLWHARRRKIPFVLHETDAVAGLVTRQFARAAAVVCATFPTLKLGSAKVTVTGNPLRREFFARVRRPTPNHLLVTGGSQGARNLNSLVLAIIPRLLKEKLTITHLTGELDYPRIHTYARPGYTVLPQTSAMATLLGEATIVISRAGGTIFEIAAMARPSILVPLPSAANNHQVANARYFKKAKASVVVEEKEGAEALWAAIMALVRQPLRLELMRAAARKLAPLGATEKIVRILIALALDRPALT